MLLILGRRKGLDPRTQNVAGGMFRPCIAGIALCLAAAFWTPVAAQDVKLYLKDGAVDLYKDKKSYALVIGIDKYRAGPRPLTNAVSDAQKVAAELSKHGFATIRTFTDPNMTGKQLRDEIDRFVQDYGFIEDSRILIWFAGHGMTIDGEGYLMGVDAPTLAKDSQSLDNDLKAFYSASMPLRTFGVYLRQMRSRHVLLVIDSCFAGTIFTNTRANASIETNREMARPARQIITAGLAGEEVADNGNFADMFIRAINGQPGPGDVYADQSKDGYLSGTELGNFLAITAGGSGQHPQYGKLRREVDQGATNPRNPLFVTSQLDLERGEFFFLLPNAPAEPVVVAKLEKEGSRSAAVEATVWRPLEAGSHIANSHADPAPVFDIEPPQVGERSSALGAGEQFPAKGSSVAFERATIGDKKWIRFKRGGIYNYVMEDDVEIIRPN
ncbi:caspase family protein [Mesorhizobium sp. M0913]|uniref:caspase family protein n=1 Tax=Mesorhizobium sp. M0913 TaxID=2957026 RepID=UPI003337DB0E